MKNMFRVFSVRLSYEIAQFYRNRLFVIVRGILMLLVVPCEAIYCALNRSDTLKHVLSMRC